MLGGIGQIGGVGRVGRSQARGAAVVDNGMGWTIQTAHRVTVSADIVTTTGERSFEKTSGENDWDIIKYSLEAKEGDQRVSFLIGNIYNAALINVGFMVGDPDVAGNGFQEEIKYGFYHQDGLLFRIVDNVCPFDTLLSGAVKNDVITMDMIGGTVTARKNGGSALTIATGVADVPYRVAVAFQRVNASVGDLAHFDL